MSKIAADLRKALHDCLKANVWPVESILHKRVGRGSKRDIHREFSSLKQELIHVINQHWGSEHQTANLAVSADTVSADEYHAIQVENIKLKGAIEALQQQMALALERFDKFEDRKHLEIDNARQDAKKSIATYDEALKKEKLKYSGLEVRATQRINSLVALLEKNAIEIPFQTSLY